MASIFERVRKVCYEQFGVAEEQITSEALFLDDLKADSLDFVELMLLLEEEFAGEISKQEVLEEVMGELSTVADVVDLIAKKRIQRLVAG